MNQIDQKYFLPTVWTIWASKVGRVNHLKKMMFTVFCEITVAPFLHETRPNSWISQKQSLWSFKWDQPRFSISINLKDTAWQSGIGQTQEKMIFSVLCKITVGPFLKTTKQNSWASESFFYALLSGSGQEYFLPTV